MLRINKITALLIFVFCAGALFLGCIGIDSLEGKSDFQFFADSPTYHAAVAGELPGFDVDTDLINISANYLGPFIILKALGSNYWLIFVFNLIVFYASVRAISVALDIKASRFAVVLLLNPLTVSSLLSVNKEIIAFASIALLLCGLKRSSIGYLFLAVLLAVLVRWQMAVVVGLVYFSGWFLGKGIKYRGLYIVLLSIVISIGWLVFSDFFSGVREVLENTADEHEGSGIFVMLNSLQEQGLYWLAWPIKAALMIFGLGLRFDRILALDNVYNDLMIVLFSFSMLIMFALLLKRGKATVRHDLFFISLIYILIFTLSPIFSPRYFYPVYVIWSALLLKSGCVALVRRHGFR